MATLAVQQIPVTGFTPTFAAAGAGGDAANPDDRTFLRVKNGSASPINLTLVVPGLDVGGARPDPVIVIPATTGDVLVNLAVPALTDPATGLVSWTYSAVASISIALVRV